MRIHPPPSSARTRIGRFSGDLHMVTGATGFLGAAISLEILRAGCGVVAVVRSGNENEEVRFIKALRAAAKVYGIPLDASVYQRVYAVTGDLLDQLSGVELRGLYDVKQLWHSAASLRYENRYQDEIKATNIGGTGNVLELAEKLGIETFNYVSTAYVAGCREGTILEEMPEAGGTNNHYEASKIEAERMVAASKLRARIFRPSIVVGHSQTLAATAFTGFYGFVRQLRQFRGVVERTQKGLLERQSLRIRLDPDSTVNLIPVDQVANETVKIGLSDVDSGIFHITHQAPPKAGETTRIIFDELGLREPEFVDQTAELPWLDAKFDSRLDFYGAYLRGRKQFDRTQADAALGGPRLPVSYDQGRIRAMTRWYLTKLEQERSSLPAAR